MKVTLEIPTLLADACGGVTDLPLDSTTLPDAYAEVRRRWPVLAELVLDESNAPRTHVLFLLNGRCTRWLPEPDAPLSEGDRLTILQAVSGG